LHARRLALEIRFSDYRETAARVAVPPAHSEEALLAAAAAALDRALTRRVRLRKITLRLEGLAPANPQLELFTSTAAPRRAALEHAVDRIRDRYGENVIRFGRTAAWPASAATAGAQKKRIRRRW
ncbi:MAG TPA: hypothetical protein PLN61_09605, partial [bacterium]|nr:hypothetical protein [bacterium]